MKAFSARVILLLSFVLYGSFSLLSAEAQASGAAGFPNAPAADGRPADIAPEAGLQPGGAQSPAAGDLNWTPAALGELSALATTRSNFSLDRTALGFAAGLIPDTEPETRHVIAKLDGVSVHVLRFGVSGVPDEAAVDGIRQAYHVSGWKHLAGPNSIRRTNTAEYTRKGTTDLWVLMDGVNVHEVVALIESPASLTLVTVAGNISPVDLLHLRGHFGIPRFDGDSIQGVRER